MRPIKLHHSIIIKLGKTKVRFQAENINAPNLAALCMHSVIESILKEAQKGKKTQTFRHVETTYCS